MGIRLYLPYTYHIIITLLYILQDILYYRILLCFQYIQVIYQAKILQHYYHLYILQYILLILYIYNAYLKSTTIISIYYSIYCLYYIYTILQDKTFLLFLIFNSYLMICLCFQGPLTTPRENSNCLDLPQSLPYNSYSFLQFLKIFSLNGHSL